MVGQPPTDHYLRCSLFTITGLIHVLYFCFIGRIRDQLPLKEGNCPVLPNEVLAYIANWKSLQKLTLAGEKASASFLSFLFFPSFSLSFLLSFLSILLS